MLNYLIGTLQWSMWDSSLMLTGSSCETSCPRSYYISTTTSQATGVYDNNVWTSWGSSWYEWAGSSSSQCLSWPKTKYLSLGSTGSKLGTWTTNTGTSTTINIFVKPSYVETTGDGSYSNPFGNIVKALSYADEQAANKGETTINICKSYLNMLRFAKWKPLHDKKLQPLQLLQIKDKWLLVQSKHQHPASILRSNTWRTQFSEHRHRLNQHNV